MLAAIFPFLPALVADFLGLTPALDVYNERSMPVGVNVLQRKPDSRMLFCDPCHRYFDCVHGIAAVPQSYAVHHG